MILKIKKNNDVRFQGIIDKVEMDDIIYMDVNFFETDNGSYIFGNDNGTVMFNKEDITILSCHDIIKKSERELKDIFPEV